MRLVEVLYFYLMPEVATIENISISNKHSSAGWERQENW